MDCKGLLSKHEIIRSNLVLKCIFEMKGSVKDISFAHINAVLGLAGSDAGCKSVDLPYNLAALRAYDRIRIINKENEKETYRSMAELFWTKIVYKVLDKMEKGRDRRRNSLYVEVYTV